MSKDICEELKTILQNSKPDSSMGFSPNDLETIRQKTSKLTFDERANLFMNFLTPAGTILYDAGGLFEARIKIDDKNSKASQNRPLAYIKFTDGKKARVEVIDIFESVRSDATLIGHPVIVFAIQHWQKLLIWEKYSKQEDVYGKDKKNKAFNEFVYIPFVESARHNLEAIGKALLEGARRQSVPKEYALTLKIKELKLEDKNTYLFFAWERLAAKYINSTHELDKRIIAIEEFLSQLPTVQNGKRLADFPRELQKFGFIESTISITSVINFLKTDGKSFVYDEDIDDKSLRPRWKVFQNAYIKWFFKKGGSTVEQYQKIAKKQTIEDKPYTNGILNSSPETNVFSFIFDIFNHPLVNFCPPIECSEKTANSRHFADLITQTNTK
ncbi:MAG TPA: hypothetical protein VNI60_00180 [Pyrinomonadaceae bacterium]|nr:hypothetical protein [Pyrinomonadaceae bacterium]